MKKGNERRFEILPNSKGDLINAIINTQIRLIELEYKLGNINAVTGEDYISKLKERLENLNENSLRKYYNVLKKIVIQKEEEYSNKIENEQNELLQQLVNDYLGENITIPNNEVVYPIVQPGFYPVQHPHFPWDDSFIQVRHC